VTTLVVVHHDDPSSRLALEVGLDLLRGEVVAVTVGGAEHDDALREAVAAGAHRAIRLTGPNGDTTSGVADAALLAPLVDELRPKLTLLGARRGRLGTYGAGPALAELTGLAHVGAVSSVRQVDDRFQVQRRREGDLETIRCPIPRSSPSNGATLCGIRPCRVVSAPGEAR
jgi:electron transfer flavoprotein beta subunit